MKFKMSCNYILPERDDMVSLDFQTESRLDSVDLSSDIANHVFISCIDFWL